MPRETKQITTPSGIVINVLSYLTGRDKRALLSAYVGTTGVSIDPITQKVEGITSDVITKAQDVAWGIVVKSVNGKTDDIINSILDLHAEDYDFIVAEVNKITADAKFEEKKTV